jgi:hypothetical protein
MTDGVLSFAFLMLILVIPYQASAARQRVQVYLWSGVILLVYSVLVVIFRVKNRGENHAVLHPCRGSLLSQPAYPFKLLL